MSQKSRALLPFILVLTLAACAGPGSPIPVVRPEVTQELGEVPGPAATPTPTLQPSEALEAAQRLVHNGQYESAIAAFQALTLDPNAPPEIVAEAHFGMGQAALRQGSFPAAQAAFDNFLTSFPDHENAAQGTFLRGEAKLGISDWAGAIADFQAYLSARPGLADSYVYERIGDAHVALGQTSEALAAYDQAILAGRNVSSLVALRERVAQVHLSTGNPQGAVDQYQAILNVAQIPSYRAKIEYLLAQAYNTAGNVEAANEHLVTLINNYPETPEAYTALQDIQVFGSNVTLDPFQQGLVEFAAEDYAAASQSFYNWLALADPEHPADAHFYLARSLARLGNPEAALSEFDTIIVTHADDPLWGQAFVEYAGVQADAGNVQGALNTLNDFMAENPDAPQRSDALALAARLSENLGDNQGATDYYVALLDANPGDTQGNEGLLRIGMAHFRAADYESAQQVLGVIVPNAQGDQLAAAHLWLGRIHEAQGRTDEAANAYAAAASADPGGYYALRAADLQSGLAPFLSPPAVNFDLDEAARQAEAEVWLVNTFGLEQTTGLSDLRPDIAGDVRTIRGRELWQLGMAEEAQLELEGLRGDYTGDPLAMYQLALFFRDLGLYNSSIKSARSLILLSGQETRSVPPFVARLHYPIYYRDLILPAAEKYGFDPLFVFALIRQESGFEGFVTSFAFAQGLMQIVPATGEEIAGRLNWPDYQNADLYRPYVSVEFGTFYLDQQRSTFDGDLFAAMAAYNAGAGRVLDWEAQSGGDIDLFVEIIPFAETYTYVTSVYAQYDVYRDLYGVGG